MEQGGAVPPRDSVAKAPSYLKFMVPSIMVTQINTIFPDMVREGSVRLRPQTPKWNELITLADREFNEVYTAKAAGVAKRLTPMMSELAPAGTSWTTTHSSDKPVASAGLGDIAFQQRDYPSALTPYPFRMRSTPIGRLNAIQVDRSQAHQRGFAIWRELPLACHGSRGRSERE
jgi:hypothetical protein